RVDARLHAEIPVTVAVDVLQGVSAGQVAQAVCGARATWDRVLFADRRRLERVSGAVDICYAVVHAPPFCDKRDALTVATFERVPFLAARQRMRNWQQLAAKGCAPALGDYVDPAFTLVEASVPGSQPLATATRALVALYAVRVEPIDAYERVSCARNYAHPACRVTVACCVDLAGNVPLALRRAASARVPELHLAHIAALCRVPADPYVVAPSTYPVLMPSGSRRRECVAGEAAEELVDGLPVCFYRFLDGHVECESGGGGTITATASVTREMLNEARNHCLRKSGPSSEAEDLPPFVPVICDIVVGSQCFAVSVDDEAEIGSPIAGARDVACGVWAGSSLAVYVFALGGGQHLVRTALVGCADEDAACTVAVRPCAEEGITVNGHPMRVHRALSRSLLFVAGERGSVLHTCRECGNVACAADAPPGAVPVAYASDESSEDEGDHPPPPPPLGLGSVLRSSRNSSCNIGHVAPAGSQSPPVQQSALLRQRTLVTQQQQRQRTSMEASEEMEAEDKSGRTSLAARAALALVSLAVFLPVRRLVIADNNSVGRWLEARTNTLPVDRRPKKSVLALLVLALTAMAAWALGVALAGLLLGF
ncbi:hypothetical protein GGI24_004898, partial [Coemansia furcata]